MEGANGVRQPAVAAQKRLVWMDLLRGLAVVGMIETHVLNAFLDRRLEESTWWLQLHFYNGLVAPAFLWIAGYVQGWMARKYISRGQPVITARRLRRLGQVALLGYMLHLPWPNWLKGDFFSAEAWRILLQTDVLQCLAVSLMILLLVAASFRRAGDAVVIVLTLLVLGISEPLAHWRSGWMVVDTWLNRDSGSLFPLLPWFAFCGMGHLASRWQPQLRWYVPLGLVLIAAGTYWRPQEFSSAHPLFFMERLGYLMIGIALVVGISRWTAPAWLQLAGRESLLVYAAHLVIIYSVPISGVPLDQWVGKRLTLVECAGVFTVLLLMCVGLAWLNERRKARRKAPV